MLVCFFSEKYFSGIKRPLDFSKEIDSVPYEVHFPNRNPTRLISDYEMRIPDLNLVFTVTPRYGSPECARATFSCFLTDRHNTMQLSLSERRTACTKRWWEQKCFSRGKGVISESMHLLIRRRYMLLLVWHLCPDTAVLYMIRHTMIISPAESWNGIMNEGTSVLGHWIPWSLLPDQRGTTVKC